MQEAIRENSAQELGRLETQLAGLQQDLAALTLKQSTVEDEVGLLPQKIQAVREEVSGKHLRPRQTPTVQDPGRLHSRGLLSLPVIPRRLLQSWT